MKNDQNLTDSFIYICSNNPLAVWAVESLLIRNTVNRSVSVWFPDELGVPAQKVHVIIIDTSSVTEWPEVVHKWTCSGHKTILLVTERWCSRGADLRALHLGVHGVVPVSRELAKELPEAVKLVESGQLFAKRETLEQFYAGSRRFRPQRASPMHLSFREEQVLDLLLKGFSNKRIATVLEISERTAKFHVCNILRKLDVANRRQLLADKPNTLGRYESA